MVMLLRGDSEATPGAVALVLRPRFMRYQPYGSIATPQSRLFVRRAADYLAICIAAHEALHQEYGYVYGAQYESKCRGTCFDRALQEMDRATDILAKKQQNKHAWHTVREVVQAHGQLSSDDLLQCALKHYDTHIRPVVSLVASMARRWNRLHAHMVKAQALAAVVYDDNADTSDDSASDTGSDSDA